MAFPPPHLQLLKLSLIITTFHKFVINILRYILNQEHTAATTPSQQHRPSPLLVPLPFGVTTGSISQCLDHLPVVKCSRIIKKLGLKKNLCFCAVCLNFINGCNEVRELGNCFHIFHRECVDAWIGEGKQTCPVCRLRLFGSDEDQVAKNKCREGEDPWRRERMIYLFGEDMDFH